MHRESDLAGVVVPARRLQPEAILPAPAALVDLHCLRLRPPPCCADAVTARPTAMMLMCRTGSADTQWPRSGSLPCHSSSCPQSFSGSRSDGWCGPSCGCSSRPFSYPQRRSGDAADTRAPSRRHQRTRPPTHGKREDPLRRVFAFHGPPGRNAVWCASSSASASAVGLPPAAIRASRSRAGVHGLRRCRTTSLRHL